MQLEVSTHLGYYSYEYMVVNILLKEEFWFPKIWISNDTWWEISVALRVQDLEAG